MDYLTTHTSLSPIRRGFAPGFVNYKKGCTQLASDKVCQLLAHGRWFSPGTPASSTTKTSRHDIVEILLKVALNTINQIKSNILLNDVLVCLYKLTLKFWSKFCPDTVLYAHRCQPLRFFRYCYEFWANITVLRSTVYLLRFSDYCLPGTVPHLNIIVII